MHVRPHHQLAGKPRTAGLIAVLTSVAACGTSTGPPANLEGEPTLIGLAIEPPLGSIPQPGDSMTFRAFEAFSDGSEEPAAVRWTSDDTTVASIDAAGVTVGRSTGITFVRARTDSMVALARVAVDPDTLPPRLVTVSADDDRVDVGRGPQAVQLTAVFTDDRSGVRSALAHFSNPLGPGITGLVTLERVDEPGPGTIFEGLVDVPTNGLGTWTLSVLKATDRFGNTAQWGARDLAQRGLTVTFEVVWLGG